ncbi:hypothetical protein NKH95_01700 [Mesorhizobium sp. M0848]|uniref:hypothetical protein n=1 Tax=Mesorhizobium sp. M0848 TaxID=2957012 RepID=UPI003336D052
MNDDKIVSERHDKSRVVDSNNDGTKSSVKITRRAVLVGAASVPLAAAAQPLSNVISVPPVDVFYETQERRALVVEWTRPGQSSGNGAGRHQAFTDADRQRLILPASSFADPANPARLSRFVLARTREGWRATIAECGFPGGPSFMLSVEIALKPIANEIPVDASLSISLKFANATLGTIVLRTDSLSDFFGGSDQEIASTLKDSQARAFLQALFDNTVAFAAKAPEVTLRYKSTGAWSIAPKKGSILLLLGDKLNAAVGAIDFGVLAAGPANGVVPLRLDPAGSETADVRSLFEGDEAPPPLPAEAGRALYGIARVKAAPGPIPLWTGEVQMGQSAAKDTATLVLDLPGQGDGWMAWQHMAWRRTSTMDLHVALRSPMQLVVRRAAKGSENTVFGRCLGIVWQRLGGTPRRAAALTPMARQVPVETRYGEFFIAPLPAIAPRPGVRPRVPPIRLGASGTGTTRKLEYFVAQLALESAPDWLGSQPAGPRTAFTQPICELSFNEAEVLFRIGGLSLRGAWTKEAADSLPPAFEPPQAEALVEIGGAPTDGAPVRIALNRANLRVRRPEDLASLRFGFRDMILERGKAGWRVTPDRRLAAAVPYSRPLPEQQEERLCEDPSVSGSSPLRYGSAYDPRPLLIVEFPPQHIGERAFLRRFAAEPDLPDPPLTQEVKDLASALRSGTLAERTDARNRVSQAQDNAVPTSEFSQFRKTFGSDYDAQKLPLDQRLYIGPDWLDVQASRIARKIVRQSQDINFQSADERAQALRGLPQVELPSALMHALSPGPGPLPAPHDWPAGIAADVPDPPTDKVQLAFIVAREQARDRRDPDYAAFNAFYSLPKSERLKVKNLPSDIAAAISAGPTWLPGITNPKLATSRYIGRSGTLARLERSGGDTSTAAAILATLQAFDFAREQMDEGFVRPAEARLSGPSRLVFRVPLDDFDGGRPDAGPTVEPAGGFPFTFEALTNWGAFDLAVVRRAERLFEPLAAWAASTEEAGPGGLLPPSWARVETRDEAAKLLYQGLTRGDSWAVRHDENRALNADAYCPPALGRLGTVTSRLRMAEIVASVKAPRWDETAIEMPFRVLLSPAQDARFRVRLPVTGAGADFQLRSDGPVPLWFAWLDEAAGAASVRAVWSPDFRPEALVDSQGGAPPHGPWAPWAMPRSVTSRDPYGGAEPLYGKGGSDATDDYCAQNPGDCVAPERFRTGLDAGDRHEIVALSSLYGLPVLGARDEKGAILDASQAPVPSGFRLRDAVLETLNGEPASSTNPVGDWSTIYRPKALGVTELSLTALGGTFVADTDFSPPASARVKDGALFDAFALERWSQATVLGRDVRVEAVYKGFLFPLGHRASLVKLTERRMMPVEPKGPPVAFLVQRFFLRIGKPDKKYPAAGQPNGGRTWPPGRVDILTRVTPDLLDPADSSPEQDGTHETRSGRIYLRPVDKPTQTLPGLVFWPRVSPGEGGEVQFELQIDQRGTPARMPLIFVDNTAVNDEQALKALTVWYNGLADVTPPNWRTVLPLGGSKRRYAAEQEPDATSFETLDWTIKSEGRQTDLITVDREKGFGFHNETFTSTPLMAGVDQPPFYPIMASGNVRITQIERMTGGGVSWTPIIFDHEYRAFGFPPDDRLKAKATPGADERAAKTDIYIDIRGETKLDIRRAGDRIGGPARPDTTFKGVSRSRGPIGGGSTSTKAVALNRPASTGMDTPDPSTFFDQSSRLLGIFTIGQVISFLTATLSDTPRFKELTHYVSSVAEDLDSTSANARAAAAAKVRDLVLLPMREALTDLARQFYLATRTDQTPFDAATERKMVGRLGYLYPDLAKAWTGLSGALDNAIAVAGTADGASALLNAFADIYATGRLFLEAIERVAADPVSPALAALRDTVNVAFEGLAAQAAKIAGTEAGALKQQLGDLQKRVCDQVSELFAVGTTQFRAWRRLVFALPGQQGVNMGSATVEAFETAVETALAAASVTILEGLCARRSPDDLAAPIAQAFIAAMNDAIGAKTTDLQKALAQALDEWRLGAMTDAERITGTMFSAGLNMVGQLLAAAADLQAAAEASATAVIAAAVDAGRAAINAAGAAADQALDKIDEICATATRVMQSLADELLPTTALIAAARNDVAAKLEALAQELEGLNPPQPALAATTRTIRGSLLGAMAPAVALEASVLQAGTIIKGLMPAYACADPTQFSAALDALVALPRHRVALVQALVALPRTVAAQTPPLAQLLKDVASLSSAPWPAAQDVCESVAVAVQAAADMAKDATALGRFKASEAQSILRATRDAAKLFPPLQQTLDAMVTQGLADAMTVLQTGLSGAVANPPLQTIGDIERFAQALGDASALVEGHLITLADQICAGFERPVIDAVAFRLAASRSFVERLLAAGAVVLSSATAVLANLQSRLVDARDGIWKSLGGGPFTPNAGSTPDEILNDLAGLTKAKLRELLAVGYPQSRRAGLPDENDPKQADPRDYLRAERIELDRLAQLPDVAAWLGNPPNAIEQAAALFDDWGHGRSSAALLFDNLRKAADVVLSGDLKRLVDLEGARRVIDERLRSLVPSQISVEYDLESDLSPFPTSKPIFIPGDQSRLVIAASAVYDLLDAGRAPVLKAECRIEAFDINLFDIVTLIFDGARFTSGSEQGSHFDLTYKDFQLGPTAAFLQPLQALMNPGASGPFVRPLAGRPGIEAGYTLDLGIISIAAMSFSNVAIRASCSLPFDNSEAEFTASIGAEDRPVLLSILPYTGGGFLSLTSSAKRITGFAASFEFGGGGAFQFGPLSGQGRISTGIYLRKYMQDDQDFVVIDGFFYAGGEAHIACFGVAATLVVRVGQDAGGNLVGRATFTYSFSLGITKVEFKVGVSRRIGKGFGGGGGAGSSGDTLRLAKRPPFIVGMAGTRADAEIATVACQAVSQVEDWARYLTYFANDISGFAND